MDIVHFVTKSTFKMMMGRKRQETNVKQKKNTRKHNHTLRGHEKRSSRRPLDLNPPQEPFLLHPSIEGGYPLGFLRVAGDTSPVVLKPLLLLLLMLLLLLLPTPLILLPLPPPLAA